MDDGGGFGDKVGGNADVEVVEVGVGDSGGGNVWLWVCCAQLLESALDLEDGWVKCQGEDGGG